MRKFERISEADFEAKLDSAMVTAYNNNNWHLPSAGEWRSTSVMNTLTARVEKDLSKVEFDNENYGCDLEPDWQGIHTLDNGLTYLGYYAGGDWECPIFFIIYWDGQELRGYIPKDGNPWNRTTKKAYGNDDDADLLDQIKHLGLDPESEWPTNDLDWDWPAISADIINRIKE